MIHLPANGKCAALQFGATGDGHENDARGLSG